jgi:hypothetical protein
MTRYLLPGIERYKVRDAVHLVVLGATEEEKAGEARTSRLVGLTTEVIQPDS